MYMSPFLVSLFWIAPPTLWTWLRTMKPTETAGSQGFFPKFSGSRFALPCTILKPLCHRGLKQHYDDQDPADYPFRAGYRFVLICPDLLVEAFKPFKHGIPPIMPL